jgi:hypothetical protein
MPSYADAGAQDASAGSVRRHHVRAMIANGNHLARPRLVVCVDVGFHAITETQRSFDQKQTGWVR